MSDREYWQKYRDSLNSRIALMQASRMNTLGVTRPAIAFTHKDVRAARQIRDAENHLAMVDRLLAYSGQLE